MKPEVIDAVAVIPDGLRGTGPQVGFELLESSSTLLRRVRGS